MIDNKKIVDVAKQHSEESYISCYFQACYKDAFTDGAKWMQEEFLKDLWHDVDEMPKKAKAFIFECGDDSMNYHIGMMFNPNDYKKNAETWHMNRWCYLEDILPKQKGGNQ